MFKICQKYKNWHFPYHRPCPISSILIGLEHEAEGFMQEYNWVINSKLIPDIKDGNIESSSGGDTYIGMEIGPLRGECNSIDHATVKTQKIMTLKVGQAVNLIKSLSLTPGNVTLNFSMGSQAFLQQTQ